MNSLVSWRLSQYCKLNGIDIHEIDNTLTYAENKKHLETFLMRTPEELAQEYGRMPDIMEPKPTETPHYIKKKWIPRPSKQQWVTVSRTSIPNISFH